MPLSLAEAKKVLPKLALDRFPMEAKATRRFDCLTPGEMTALNGWDAVGWQSAASVCPREDKEYVCLFRNEAGDEGWCHVGEGVFCLIATWTKMFSEKRVE